MDASVLEATETLGEKKEKAMKAQEEKEEEKLHRESADGCVVFLSLCYTVSRFKMFGVSTFPLVKKSLCAEKAALDQSGLRSSKGWKQLWMTSWIILLRWYWGPRALVCGKKPKRQSITW